MPSQHKRLKASVSAWAVALARDESSQHPAKKNTKFVPKKTKWSKDSPDYSQIVIQLFDHYLHELCEGKSDIKRVLMLSCLNKHFKKHVLGSDAAWFKLGSVWEDEYFVDVSPFSSVVVNNMWVVPGIFNRPRPDFEQYSISSPGVTNRCDSLSSTGVLRWNGHGRVESKESAIIRENLMDDLQDGSLEAHNKLIDLGFAYTESTFKKMAAYFRKCLYLTYSRECIMCGLAVDTVPVWALNGRVCRGCLSCNLVSNVVLYERYNIDICKILPYVVGKVWFFRSLHRLNYNVRNFTVDPIDFQAGHGHSKYNSDVPDIFVWMPHLVQYLYLPHDCPYVWPRQLLVDGKGNVFDEERNAFVKFSSSMLDNRVIVVQGERVIPRGGVTERRNAGETIGAFVQAFCVRFRFAVFGHDDKGLVSVESHDDEIREALLICYLMRTSVIMTRMEARSRLNQLLYTKVHVQSKLMSIVVGIVLEGNMRIGAGTYKTDKRLIVSRVVRAVGSRCLSFFRLSYPGGYSRMNFKDKEWFDKCSNFIGDPRHLDDELNYYHKFAVYKIRPPLPFAGGSVASGVE